MEQHGMGSPSAHTTHVVIIGAGPAGLTAAYELAKAQVPCTVLEKDAQVGGIARTVNYNGYLFDIGGHRFFTKVHAVNAMWQEILGDDFLQCRRLSRIYYNRRFFHYPLQPMNALRGLGLWNSALIIGSYCWAHLFPHQREDTFEHWITNRFGRRLYRTFFKTYTEKVWGIPCSEIKAEWAAQRIKGLSLMQAIKTALLRSTSTDQAQIREPVIKTLIDTFSYPRRGPGMMWEAVAKEAQKNGNTLRLRSTVERVVWHGDRVRVIDISGPNGHEQMEGSHFLSTMPIRELIQKMDPPPPQTVLDAANNLRYRDFLTVALIVNKPHLFPDNWLYIHEPAVKVGRIQNFKNWSPEMVPDPTTSCLGLEYFCTMGDDLWTMEDQELIGLAGRELEGLGLAQSRDVIDGIVMRMPKAYPVYDTGYREWLEIVRKFLSPLTNLQLVGRNGMHKYNNQDHSMLTAMLAVRNILGAAYDLWQVNEERDYHEAQSLDADPWQRELHELASTQPRIPERW